ncbi:hypothetical protein DE146DRAFT_633303 [Phaeosphaeria sp. MPI-PUGE-AT-0046c]|nr:hypothetical protein DE146DRAFT_633303 [Phaeosphaeria sp. MPI-PUGE-AT-0046c]
MKYTRLLLTRRDLRMGHCKIRRVPTKSSSITPPCHSIENMYAAEQNMPVAMTGRRPDWDIDTVCTVCGIFEQGHHCWNADMVAEPVTTSSSRRRGLLHDLKSPNPDLRPESRRALSIRSFNSSFVSDLISLIDRRYSLSTITTSDRYSISAFSETDALVVSLEDRVRKVLAMRQEKHVKDNAILISKCCSQRHDCIHKFIEELISHGSDSSNSFADPQRSGTLDQNIQSFTGGFLDPHKHGALFFAARVGAPLDALLALVRWAPDLNFIDASGQTWLHSLDSRVFLAYDLVSSSDSSVPSTPTCGCRCDTLSYSGYSHSSRFECLMFALEQTVTFQFDNLDNHGRHFLFYMCSSPAFDIIWLLTMMNRYTEWERRVRRVSQLRDRAGLFLIDYMAVRTDFATWDTDVRSLFQPDLNNHSPTRLLLDENDSGRTSLHVFIQKDFLDPEAHPVLPFPNDVVVRDIYRYYDQGRTPIMDLVENAFEQNLDEKIVCAKVERLLEYGANINACSRSGTTILLFAAKRAYPRLLDILLNLGAHADHCDDKGLDALAHVAKTIRISQSAKRPVELLARSFKSAAKLLSVDPGIFRKTWTRSSTPQISAGELASRSKHTLRKLLEHIEPEPRATSLVSTKQT